MPTILEKNHVGSETDWKVGSGSGTNHSGSTTLNGITVRYLRWVCLVLSLYPSSSENLSRSQRRPSLFSSSLERARASAPPSSALRALSTSCTLLLPTCKHVYHDFRVAGSRSVTKKMVHKYRKKLRIVMFWSVRCSFLRAEGFSCSLCSLYGGLRIRKLQFSIQKI